MELAQEQIHAMATHILARHAEGKLRTLAVTSALAGEGKTTMSLALAEKLSKTGKKILIIDLDAHRATLSRDAELDDAAGAMQSSDPRDPTNVGNPDGVRQIYLFRDSARGGGLRQLTFGDSDCFSPRIAPNGSSVIFCSRGDLLPGGTPHLILRCGRFE